MSKEEKQIETVSEEAENENRVKISLFEGIVMVLIVAISDTVELLVDLTGYGILIGEVVNIFTGLIIEGWLILRGVRGVSQLTSFLIGDFLDGLSGSFLPVKTISILVTIYLINHQEKSELLGKVASITEKI